MPCFENFRIVETNLEAGVSVAHAQLYDLRISRMAVRALMEKQDVGIVHATHDYKIGANAQRWARLRAADETSTDVVSASVLFARIKKCAKSIRQDAAKVMRAKKDNEDIVDWLNRLRHLPEAPDISHLSDYLYDFAAMNDDMRPLEEYIGKIPYHSIQWPALSNAITFIDNARYLHRKHNGRERSIGTFHADGYIEDELLIFGMSTDGTLLRAYSGIALDLSV